MVKFIRGSARGYAGLNGTPAPRIAKNSQRPTPPPTMQTMRTPMASRWMRLGIRADWRLAPAALASDRRGGPGDARGSAHDAALGVRKGPRNTRTRSLGVLTSPGPGGAAARSSVARRIVERRSSSETSGLTRPASRSLRTSTSSECELAATNRPSFEGALATCSNGDRDKDGVDGVLSVAGRHRDVDAGRHAEPDEPRI